MKTSKTVSSYIKDKSFEDYVSLEKIPRRSLYFVKKKGKGY